MKTKDPRKEETSKTDYMSDDSFGDLKEALEDALAFERWERRDLRVTRIAGSAHLSVGRSAIRQKLNLANKYDKVSPLSE